MTHRCTTGRIYYGVRNPDGSPAVITIKCGDKGLDGQTKLCYSCFSKTMRQLREDIVLDTRPSNRRKPKA